MTSHIVITVNLRAAFPADTFNIVGVFSTKAEAETVRSRLWGMNGDATIIVRELPTNGKSRHKQPPGTVSDFNLYTAKESEFPPPPGDELARLEREMAEGACNDYYDSIPTIDLDGDLWADQKQVKLVGQQNCLRYFELRGLLKQHPENPSLVRMKE